MKKDNVKINYAAVGRKFNVDYRTVKRYFEMDEDEIKEPKKRPSMLDPYQDLIAEKLEEGYTAKSIHYLLQKKGFQGKYSIVKKACRNKRNEALKKATIRFETNPGLQAQVDWKEELTLEDRNGQKITINIFLMLLGYSRKKYIELTLDRSQDTLFSTMINGFKYFGGIPKEIIFDNMKTVVDHSKTTYQKAAINDKFYQFSKDMGFEVWACRPYRPQTKGKVEAFARTVDGLKVFNHEFTTLDELEKIVNDFRDDLNNEISQAIECAPNELWAKEKEHLLPLPKDEILNTYLTTPILRKVSKESMIMYKKRKYSLPVKYIGKTIEIKEINGEIKFFYEKEIIGSHKISDKKFNYQKDHLTEILASDALKDKDISEIEEFAKKQLGIYDSIGG